MDPEKNDVAWHAEQSRWQDDVDLNEVSIGIEFNTANYANALSIVDFDFFSDFSSKKIQGGIELILFLME